MLLYLKQMVSNPLSKGVKLKISPTQCLLIDDQLASVASNYRIVNTINGKDLSQSKSYDQFSENGI